MKTEDQLAAEAKEIVGATASDDDLKKAMDTLREAETALGGGEPAVPSEVDALKKAVEESEEAMGSLFKSDGTPAVAGVAAEIGAAADGLGELGKSEFEELELGEEALHEEMVKASEEFADLRKSVEVGTAGTDAKLDTLLKGMALLSTVVFKQAAVVGTLTKSVQDVSAAAGKKPVGASKTQLGTKILDKGAPMEKSRTEIQADLKKAIDEGTVKPYFLSAFASKGVDGLPDDVKTIIGLEIPVA
jgi:hypothetical protein